MTLAAIRGFQRINRLKVDGIVGPNTAAALQPVVPERDIEGDGDGNAKQVWPREADCPTFYGKMGAGTSMLELPFKMRIAWNKNQYISRFTIHKKVMDSAARCFLSIHDHYGTTGIQSLGINLFGGCIASPPRRKRGSTSSWSMHSWAIAIDFDPERNQLRWGRDKARLASSDARKFWDIWEEEGWVSLGRARNFDWMHIQAARL